MIYKVKLETLENAKIFVYQCSKFHEDIDYSVGRYRIDAKSILGILSSDLRKEALVKFHSSDTDNIYRFECLIEQFRTDIGEYKIYEH